MTSRYLKSSNANPGPQIEANGSCPCFSNPSREPSKSNLQPGSHQYTDLVEMIIRRAKHNPLCHQMQNDALSKALIYSEKTYDSDAPSIDDLRNWARIFDGLFFFGALHENERCRVNWDSELRDKEESYGLAKPSLECARHQQIHRVEILVDPSPRKKVNGSLFLSILITLLHELCHAALMIYGCKQTMDARTHVILFGLTGHGHSFFRLFKKILGAVDKKLGCRINRELAYSTSRKTEHKALKEALEKVKKTPSQISKMKLAKVEKALKRGGFEPSIYWKAHKPSRRNSRRSKIVGNKAEDFRQDTALSEN